MHPRLVQRGGCGAGRAPCGCGTAVHAAQKLGRRWIGIDITPLATNLIRSRLEDAFPGLSVPIRGWPDDMAGAINWPRRPTSTTSRTGR